MRYFAELDENNIVQRVLCVADEDVGNLYFPESEEVGNAFLNSFLPASTWKETCCEGNFRFRPAHIGFTFHPEYGEHGGFSCPKFDDTFVWDASVCDWVPPVPYPTDGRDYEWVPQTQRWTVILQTPPQTTFIG